MALTYLQFTNLIGKQQFLKIARSDLTHNGLTYKLGINEDIQTFNPNGSCTKGGLYFSTSNLVWKFIAYGTLVATIELLPDALFYIDPDGDKFKTNKFIITSLVTLKEYFCNKSDVIQMDAVKINGFIIQYVPKQTEELCVAAVKYNGCVLKYISTQTDKICLAAVKVDGHALQYVLNQTNEICLTAVKENGYALQYVHIQTEEMCLVAVSLDSYALMYVHNQTEKICLAAVQRDGYTLKYVKKQTEEICLAAIKNNGRAIVYVRNKTKELYNEASKWDEYMIQRPDIFAQ